LEVVAKRPDGLAKFQAWGYARWTGLIETRKITAD